MITSLHRWAQCASLTLQLGISPTAAPSVFRSDVSHVGRTDIPARSFNKSACHIYPTHLGRWTRRPPWSPPQSSSPWSSTTATPTQRSTSAGIHDLLETPCNLIKSLSLNKLFQGSWTRNWSPKSAPATTLRASTTLTYSLSRCHGESRQIYFHNQHFELVLCFGLSWEVRASFIFCTFTGGAKAWSWNWGRHPGLWQVWNTHELSGI